MDPWKLAEEQICGRRPYSGVRSRVNSGPPIKYHRPLKKYQVNQTNSTPAAPLYTTGKDETFTVPTPKCLNYKLNRAHALNTTYTVDQTGDDNSSFTFQDPPTGETSISPRCSSVKSDTHTPTQLQQHSRVNHPFSNSTSPAPSPPALAVPAPKVGKRRRNLQQNPLGSSEFVQPLSSTPRQIHYITRPGSTRFKIKCSRQKQVPINKSPPQIGTVELQDLCDNSLTSKSVLYNTPTSTKYFLWKSNQPIRTRILSSRGDPVRHKFNHRLTEQRAFSASCPSVSSEEGELHEDSLEPQFSDQSQPQYPEWHTPGVRLDPSTGGYEPIYEGAEQQRPCDTHQYKHQVPERLDSAASKMPKEFRKKWNTSGDMHGYTTQRQMKNQFTAIQPVNLRDYPHAENANPSFRSSTRTKSIHQGGSQALGTDLEPCMINKKQLQPGFRNPSSFPPNLMDRKLQEHLQPVLRNSAPFSPHISKECCNQVSSQAYQPRRIRASWSSTREEPKYAEKTPSPKIDRKKWETPCEGKLDVIVEEPSWVQCAQIRQEISRSSLPNWARNVDFSSSGQHWPDFQLKDDEEEDNKETSTRKHLTFLPQSTDKAIPSWARQITINTLNETVIFKDDELVAKNKTSRMQRKMSRSTSGSYLDTLPDWVRNHEGEEQYLEKLPEWVNNIDSSVCLSDKTKNSFNGEHKTVRRNLLSHFQDSYKLNEKTSVPRQQFPRRGTEDCSKGLELVLSLMKTPIEMFDKLMAYLMTPGAIDEEDITGVENFDEFNCKQSTYDGENFLAFVKENHLKQGITYCDIAAQKLIKQHINETSLARKQRSNKGNLTLREKYLNTVEASKVKQIHQSDEQIEIIGYVGCTGNNKVNINECKQDGTMKPNMEEVHEFEDCS